MNMHMIKRFSSTLAFLSLFLFVPFGAASVNSTNADTAESARCVTAATFVGNPEISGVILLAAKPGWDASGRKGITRGKGGPSKFEPDPQSCDEIIRRGKGKDCIWEIRNECDADGKCKVVCTQVCRPSMQDREGGG